MLRVLLSHWNKKNVAMMRPTLALLAQGPLLAPKDLFTFDTYWEKAGHQHKLKTPVENVILIERRSGKKLF